MFCDIVFCCRFFLSQTLSVLSSVSFLLQEGRQASLAADFSITHFRYVGRLLVWHGRNRCAPYFYCSTLKNNNFIRGKTLREQSLFVTYRRHYSFLSCSPLLYQYFRLYICCLGQSVKNKADFSDFPRMTPILKESLPTTPFRWKVKFPSNTISWKSIVNLGRNIELCSDEGLTLETSANILFTAFSISTPTLR